MALVDQSSKFSPKDPKKYYSTPATQNKNTLENKLRTNSSVFVPLQFQKYSPTSPKGVPAPREFSSAVGSATPQGSFSNAFSNAFNLSLI